MKKKGFYLVFEKTDMIGITCSIAYLTDIDEFQICIHIGNIIGAVGYRFKERW